MTDDRPRRWTSLPLGLAASIALSAAGCGGSETTTVQMTPESQKQTEDYLKNYQKSMFEKHSKKAAPKKAN
jgi:hypothetical protein